VEHAQVVKQKMNQYLLALDHKRGETHQRITVMQPGMDSPRNPTEWGRAVTSVPSA